MSPGSMWELHDGKAQVGPLDDEHVLRMILAGLPESTLVRLAGTEDWKSARSYPPFAMAFDRRSKPSFLHGLTRLLRWGVSFTRQHYQANRAAFLMGSVTLLVFVWIGERLACAPTPATVSAAQYAPPQPVYQPARAQPQAPSVGDTLMQAKTWKDALAATRPMMADKPGDSSPGTVLLVAWSAPHLRWADVDVERKDETTWGAIKKDVDAERGKRLCATGSIIEITSQPLGDDKVYPGLLTTLSGHLVHFYAVRSTEKVVEGVQAHFCGIVTGLFDYENSSGGVGHAVDMVIMFGLPENRVLK